MSYRNMVSIAAIFFKANLTIATRLSASYSNLARHHLQGTDAIACYDELMRADPMGANGLVNRENTLKEIGRVSEAIQDYIHGVNIRPTIAEAHANLASVYKDKFYKLHGTGFVREL